MGNTNRLGGHVYAAVREMERDALGLVVYQRSLRERAEMMRRYWVVVHALLAHDCGHLWLCGPRGQVGDTP